MKVKDIKFEEFEFHSSNGLLNTRRHYDNGKIIAEMQLVCSRIENKPVFHVSIDLYKCLGIDEFGSNLWGALIGTQKDMVSIKGKSLKKYKISRDGYDYLTENDKDDIDKKYMPWVLSAIQFYAEANKDLIIRSPW